MAEPLVNQFITPSFITSLGAEIEKFYPEWSQGKFENELYENWDDLALKQRLTRVAEILANHLPKDYLQALEILKKACLPFKGFDGLVFSSFVELHGLDHFEESLKALELFTRHGSAEGAVRPFILKYESETMKQMLLWSQHESEHVRRLSSEGCRPRLPWMMALPRFKKDPSLILPILENLKADPSEYVRKSVANNLNDLTKDNPDLVIERLEKWAGSDSKETKWIIKHALRSLVKAGNKRALEILGFKEVKITLSGLTVKTPKVNFGNYLDFSFTLKNEEGDVVSMVVDYIIYFQKANGDLAPKVFKLKNLELDSKSQIRLTKSHGVQPISTRKYYPGPHKVAIQVNGQILGEKEFELVMS